MNVTRSLDAASRDADANLNSLLTRVALLRNQLRSVPSERPLLLTDPIYHRAAKIYTDELLLTFFNQLSRGESNPIFYDADLAKLID